MSSSTNTKRPWDTQTKAFEEAAAAILRRARRPLTLREITSRMISEGLVAPTGKTPHKSLYNIIRRANERQTGRRSRPRFRVHREGRIVKYSLAKD